MSVVSSSYTVKKSTHWGVLYSAVALTTMATLVLELSLTRIFSVVFYYHFAFLAISIALFGLGAGGVLSYYIAGEGKPLYRKLGAVAAANALSVVVSLAMILSMAEARGSGGLRRSTLCRAFRSSYRGLRFPWYCHDHFAGGPGLLL